MRWLIAAALVVAPATAQAMTVEELLAKVAALKKRGLFAITSPDIGLIRAEMTAVAAEYRADVTAARLQGRQPHSCPPPKGSRSANISSSDFLSALEMTVPAHERSTTSMKTAFYAVMKRRFPCTG